MEGEDPGLAGLESSEGTPGRQEMECGLWPSGECRAWELWGIGGGRGLSPDDRPGSNSAGQVDGGAISWAVGTGEAGVCLWIAAIWRRAWVPGETSKWRRPVGSVTCESSLGERGGLPVVRSSLLYVFATFVFLGMVFPFFPVCIFSPPLLPFSYNRDYATQDVPLLGCCLSTSGSLVTTSCLLKWSLSCTFERSASNSSLW